MAAISCCSTAWQCCAAKPGTGGASAVWPPRQPGLPGTGPVGPWPGTVFPSSVAASVLGGSTVPGRTAAGAGLPTLVGAFGARAAGTVFLLGFLIWRVPPAMPSQGRACAVVTACFDCSAFIGLCAACLLWSAQPHGLACTQARSSVESATAKTRTAAPAHQAGVQGRAHPRQIQTIQKEEQLVRMQCALWLQTIWKALPQAQRQLLFLLWPGPLRAGRWVSCAAAAGECRGRVLHERFDCIDRAGPAWRYFFYSRLQR